MGWRKTSVEGRVMWERNGERIADASLIDVMEGNAKRVNESIDQGAWLLTVGFILGVVCGFIAAYAILT